MTSKRNLILTVIIRFVVYFINTRTGSCETTQAPQNTQTTIQTGVDKLMLTDPVNKWIYTSSLSTTGLTSLTVPFIGIIGEPFAIAYDQEQDYIYWTDISLSKIHRARYNGTDHKTIIDGVYGTGLSIDFSSRRMFWTEFHLKRIEVAYLNGTGRSSVITDGLIRPRAIVVDSLHGWIFWSDSGTGKIERAYLDGSNREVVIGSSLPSTYGIAVDQVGNILYWCDTYFKRIETSDLFGNFREILISYNSDGTACFSIAIHAEYLYWTDYGIGLKRFNRYETGSVIEQVDWNGGVSGLHVYQVDECASSPCQNNGTCHDFFNSFQCACLEGFTGNFCEKVDECASGPCQNNGTCYDFTNAYLCACPRGFTGSFCEKDCKDGPSQTAYLIAVVIVCALILLMLPAFVFFCRFYYTQKNKELEDTNGMNMDDYVTATANALGNREYERSLPAINDARAAAPDLESKICVNSSCEDPNKYLSVESLYTNMQ